MAHPTSLLRRPLLAALPLACLSVLLFLAHPAPGAGQDPVPSDAQPEPEPADDVAYLRFVVEAAERTATGTASAARLRARAVVGSLESSGVEADEIELGEVEMISVLERQRIGSSRRPSPPARVIGYRAWLPVTVTTPALERVDYLVGRAAGAGAYLEWVDYGAEGEERPPALIGR